MVQVLVVGEGFRNSCHGAQYHPHPCTHYPNSLNKFRITLTEALLGPNLGFVGVSLGVFGSMRLREASLLRSPELLTITEAHTLNRS